MNITATQEDVRRLPVEERLDRLKRLNGRELEFLLQDWDFWARPNQKVPCQDANPRTPDGSWTVWLAKAGRGWGKTRVGAETVRAWTRDFDMVNLIGATADDARDIMIEGESGILACCPRWERPDYRKSERKLLWPNGARSLIFTADEPERLRGKQHKKAWADEIGAWRYAEAWDQLMLGLRLGNCPQCVATTTPRPTPFIKELMADPTVLVTHGTTYDNRANLAPAFFSRVINKYEGTRLGRQELNAEVLDDNPGALWTHVGIDRDRVTKLDVPMDMLRIVVGVDPAVTSTNTSDDVGIVCVGRDRRPVPHFYVFDDASLERASPDTWAKVAVDTYRTWMADVLVAEVNNGGDLVEAVIRHKDHAVHFQKVTATRGKTVRAEPISALYEQGRVHHVGFFPKLEDQMCDWDPMISPEKQKSPGRMDGLVWAITQLSDDAYSPRPVTGGRRQR